MSPSTARIAGPVALAAAIAAVYLAWSPPSTDLAAQTFRAELFAEHGFLIWNNAWYGGHYLPGYSLLYPPLAAAVGVRVAGAAAALAAVALFAVLAERRFGRRGLAGALAFGLGAGAWLFTGRMTFMLGVAVALAAVLAADRRRLWPAAALAALAALASPVAGLFCALAGIAVALAGDRSRGAVLALPPAAVIGALTLAFPVGGEQPLAFSTFVAVPAFAAFALWLLPAEQRALRIGVVAYALLAIAVLLVPNPLGSNVARLGALFGAPVAALALSRRPLVLAAVALPLLYWQLNAPVRDTIKGIGDPATERSYFAPLLAELDRATAARGAGEAETARVHVPPTENRWESVYVAERYPLARGWLRQLESDDFELFTDGELEPASYRAWLERNHVTYVAVPDADLDFLAEDEAALIERGLRFLVPVWSGEHWRLYRFAAAGDVGLEALGVERLGPERFTLSGERPGERPTGIRWSSYWRVVAGEACVRRDGDWTVLEPREAPFAVTVAARPSFAGALGRDRACSA